MDDIVKITCYGKTSEMPRDKAKEKYLEAMMWCEGAERDRYTTIYCQLCAGNKEVCDE